jgi:hypothetical protein
MLKKAVQVQLGCHRVQKCNPNPFWRFGNSWAMDYSGHLYENYRSFKAALFPAAKVMY